MKTVYMHLTLGTFWVIVAVAMGFVRGWDISVAVLALVGCIFYRAAYKCYVNPGKYDKSRNPYAKYTKKK